jgi:SAM-dependent methyltransferase
MDPAQGHRQGNVERFSGFADCYDAYRPAPPAIIVDILAQLARVDRPALVVDLGSGTGLSTRLWTGRAEAVAGVEPNPDMRRQAEASTTPPDATIHYKEGFASETGLPNACADIVTCSQSLHWLEPDPTFREVARILRPGGVFAAYDCDWPPSVDWEAEAAYEAVMVRAAALEDERGFSQRIKSWPKSGHLGRIRNSGYFCYTREIAVHQVEPGNAERLVGLALSQGGVATLLKHGVSEEEIGLDILRAEAGRILGDEPKPWFWTYRIRLGIK